MSSQAKASAPPSKGGKKLPILIASVLLLAGVGVVAFQKLAKKPDATHEAEAKKPVVIDPGVLEPEPFVFNLTDPTGDRYVRIRLSIVLDQKTIAKRAETGLAEVKLRDRVLAMLAKKRASQLTSPEGKEHVRQELMKLIESLLLEPPFHEEGTDPASAHVQDVLFNEFLVQ